MLTSAALAVLTLNGCATAYYSAWEKVGYHKRDILEERVEEARDAQADAQVEFKDALEQFGSVVAIEDTDLKRAYDKLNTEYEDSLAAAELVSERVDEVDDVANALFEEWNDELGQYTNAKLRRSAKSQLDETKSNYSKLLRTMRNAESSMKPVLNTFKDNVLYLKHNLNAQAVGALRGEFQSLQTDVQRLIKEMNKSIAESDKFIASMSKG
jgi:hypothetical protein